jgi:hypothetical protein
MTTDVCPKCKKGEMMEAFFATDKVVVEKRLGYRTFQCYGITGSQKVGSLGMSFMEKEAGCGYTEKRPIKTNGESK